MRKINQRNTTCSATVILIVSLLFLILQGCGGSSEKSTSNDNQPPIDTQTGIIVIGDTSINTAQAVELLLYYPNDTLTDISWQQTAGTELIFHAKNSKVIAFTPTSPESYSFEVSFKRNGINETLSHSLTVTDTQSKISARLGHAALEGSPVSLRVTLDDSSLASSSIVWQQTAGPTITFSGATDGQYAVFFNAPAVNFDSLLTFSVSAVSDSTRYEDQVTILVESAPEISTNSNIAYDTRLARVFPFDVSSAYADTLVNCVYSNTIDFRTTCRLNELPLIAQDTTSPTVDDIMARVVVSHQWMGKRFKAFLENNDPHNDFKNLLRATTAIVISYDVRPSYYWAVTGAIHLDPNNLWLTPEERDTINQAPDYRASFGDSLNFVMPWRYVKDNNYANVFYPENMRLTRDASDGVYNLASLMYHELAHANDYFAQSSWASLNPNDRILDAAEKIIQSPGIQSTLLSSALPLRGQEMYRLAKVRYQGETATATEVNYSPSDVTGFFSPEQAPQFYNYTSEREDYAMLFDGFMMKARYGVDRDIAITNQPQSQNEQYIVNWGQRGRIGDVNIKQRVDYVTRRILPEFTSATDIINNLPAPIMMTSGQTWAENLAISPINTTTKNNVVNSTPSEHSNSEYTNIAMPLFYEKPMPIRSRH